MNLFDILPNLGQLRLFIFLIIGIAVGLEILWCKVFGKQLYNPKEAAANISILLIGRLLGIALTAYVIGVLRLLHTYCLWPIPETPWSWLAAFVLVDFWFYWQHRLSHSIKYFWALHEVHHSSPWMNLTTSFRLHWFGPLLTPFFFGPLALLGFSARQILSLVLLNLLYQFFLHTQLIGKLGPLEGIINTPSAHRVHHGRNKAYVRKNFGGVLMLWDRIFGTYAPEVEPVRYGTGAGFVGHNPFVIQFRGLFRLAKALSPKTAFAAPLAKASALHESRAGNLGKNG
jgi:sterol desaturase/sphingolipid hydroxylase (fatty acid hydroxylase superfamily)